MHYTLFPFPLPYYLLLYPIDYSMHSDGVLIDVMVGCGVDNVPWFYCRKPMRESHKHRDRANAVHRRAFQSTQLAFTHTMLVIPAIMLSSPMGSLFYITAYAHLALFL